MLHSSALMAMVVVAVTVVAVTVVAMTVVAVVAVMRKVLVHATCRELRAQIGGELVAMVYELLN